MLGIKQIKCDGTEVELNRKHLTLEEAQDLVATGTGRSLIELVALRMDPYKIGSHVMFVHEEGLLHDLPINAKASQLCGRHIVGDVIIVENEKSDFSDEEDAA